jgi:transcription antitermination factor NusG
MDTYLPNKKYHWHAVYLNYRSEFKVEQELKSRRIECFLPVKITKRIWSDRIKIIKEPLFNSYIFIKISNLEYWDVLMVKGVLKYITFENKPATIPDNKITMLKTFLENVNENVSVSSERFEIGNKVKIIHGPLKNTEGEVTEYMGKRFAIIRFQYLGFTVKVDLGQNEVELIA